MMLPLQFNNRVALRSCNRLLTSLTVLAISTAQAGFIMRIPLEQSDSIKFINKQPAAPSENWIATTPLESDWVSVGEPFNCTNWSPEQSTVPLGETFTQTATDCDQKQTRTTQEREQETTTLEIRNIGYPTTENRTTVGKDTRDAEGVKEPWEVFADARSLSKDWNTLLWGSKNLTEIPSTPYPLTSVDTIYLFNNQLTNIDGLKNITSVTGQISLSMNQLTDVDALINITSVSGLILHSNQLTNIDGLKNIQASVLISIDKTYSGPKLAASTRFCSLNDTLRFIVPHAQKSQLCNP